MDPRLLSIIEHCLPLWREEFEIGYRAFRVSNIYREPHWLAAQIWKEWGGSGVYGPTGTDLASVTVMESAANAEEELAHYDSLRSLVEIMDVPPGDFTPRPAARELVTFRNQLWDDLLLRHAVRMSEGGGLGMLHGAIAGVESLGSPRSQDDACKTCFTAIIADEAGHLGGAIAGFLEAECDAEQEAAVLDALTICLTLKVAERREQFAAQLGGGEVSGAEYQDALAAYERRICELLGG